MARMRTRLGLVLPIVTMALLLGGLPAAAGPNEKRAQRRLNQLGCNAGPVDGRIGEWTRTGIIRFQAANGLAQSGRLTAPTRKKSSCPYDRARPHSSVIVLQTAMPADRITRRLRLSARRPNGRPSVA